MKIATWNLNSIRARLNHVVEWLENNSDVDILCLQETKVKDDDFPVEEFEEREYYVYYHGQPAYNGVAFISKMPLENIEKGFPTGDLDDQKRVISAEIDGLKIINVYCPQGESVDSLKFDFKRRFYDELATWLESEHQATEQILLCGDMNIARTEHDVHSVEKMTGRCMFTEVEHTWWDRLIQFGLVDTFRTLYPDEVKFSWWDYRMGSFQRNKGLRIDHIYVTPSVMKNVEKVEIDSEPRGWERPSDHVPVIVTL